MFFEVSAIVGVLVILGGLLGVVLCVLVGMVCVWLQQRNQLASMVAEQEKIRASLVCVLLEQDPSKFSAFAQEMVRAQCINFRTPLTLVLGATQEIMLEQEGLSYKLQRRAALAHRNALQLSRMVDDILEQFDE